jgi:hypothetical protein
MGELSDKAGVCATENCPMFGKSLKECGCVDGQHKTASPESPKEEDASGPSYGA